LFGLALYTSFNILTEHGFLDAFFTSDKLAELASNGYHGSVTESVARNALLPFLVMTGIIQIMIVVPRFKFFSVDGRIVKDIKPLLLTLMMFGLLVLAYWAICNYPQIAEFLEIVVLPWELYIAVAAMTVLWFFTTRWVLRTGVLDRTLNFTDWLYSLKLKSIRRKDR
jgi:hypothetical protein